MQTPVCTGENQSQPVSTVFTTTGSFTGGNVWTLQLSSGAGSFASPTALATISGTAAGTYTFNWDLKNFTTIAYATGYRLRVSSSSPSMNSADNGFNITIIPITFSTGANLPNPTVWNGQPYSYSLQAIDPSGASSFKYYWKQSTDQGISWGGGECGCTETNGAQFNTNNYHLYPSAIYSIDDTIPPANNNLASHLTVTPPWASRSTFCGNGTTSGYDGFEYFCDVVQVPLAGATTLPYVYGPCPSTMTVKTPNNGMNSLIVGFVNDASSSTTGSACTTNTARTLTFVPNGAPTITNYQWQISAGSNAVCTWEDIGTNSNTYNIPAGLSAGGYYYRVLVTNGNCSPPGSPVVCGQMSGDYYLGVCTPPADPTALNASPSSLICGGTPGDITLTLAGGDGNVLAGCTRPVLYSGPDVAHLTFISNCCNGVWDLNSLGVEPTVTTTYWARWENAPGGPCGSNSGWVSKTITVAANPVTTTFSGPGSPCLNSAGNVYSVTSSTTGLSYVWTISGGTINSGQGTSSVSVTWTSTSSPYIYVTATNAAGCTSVASYYYPTVQSATLSVSTTGSTNVSCLGGNNGTASITVTGGSGYTYTWSPSGGFGQTASGLSANTYTVTVTTSSGCASITSAITVSGPATALTPVATNTGNILCFGGSTGSANATATSGGWGGYSYSWSPGGATSQTVSGLSNGTYTVTVTDSKNCAKTATVNITQPASGLTASAAAGNPNCFGGTGTVTATPGGGTSAYTYLWTGGATAQTVSGLAAGNYTVTITDNNGCTKSANASIIAPSAVTATPASLPAPCGTSTGQVSVTAGGGTPAYTYSWSPGGAASQTVTGLAANTYTVTVTDSKACTKTASVVVNTSAGVVAGIASSANVNCKGNATGTAVASTSGGTPGFTYSWSPGGATSQTVSGLSANTYTVTITDINGCSSTTTVNITEPATVLSPTTGSTSATCGSNNGSVNVNVSGGTAGYTYIWSNGSTNTTVSALLSGNYTVTVTDSKGCTQSAVQTVNNSGAATVSISGSVNITCNGGNNGTATATVSGGAPPLTYSWSNGTIGVTSISGLPAGSYTLNVTDNNGCLSSSNVTLTQPGAIAPVVATQTNATCGQANGQASVTVTGGTGAYTYSWNNGSLTNSISGVPSAIYTVTVTDNKGCTGTQTANILNISGPTASISSSVNLSCNGSSNGSATVNAINGTPGYTYNWSGGGGTAATAVNLPAGTYTVTVNDVNGCTTTVSVIITQPTTLGVSTGGTITDATCGASNGQASASATGGTPGYSYLWSPGGATSQTASGLSANTYSVTITDLNGCTATTTATINNLSGPTALIQSATNVACNGQSTGNAAVTASGGTPSYTYLWSNGSTSATVSGIAANGYTVTITDANGCVATTDVTITEPSAVSALASGAPATCGSANGQVTVTPGGGTPGYTFQWTPGGATTQTVSGLAASNYTVTVTDTKGCTSSTTATVNNSGAATITLGAITNVNCNSASTGNASITAAGGTGALTYSWSNGSTTTTASNLTAGIYSVTVTDVNGCFTSSIITITQPNVVTATFVNATANCGMSNGSATANATGGTGAYTYLWSSGSTTANATNLLAGPYTVTITDANGCSQTMTTNVPSSGSAVVGVTGAAIICIGQTATLNATVTGGTPAYTYSWSGGLTGTANPNASPLTTTTYTLTVTDAIGCASTAQTITVTVNPVLNVNLTSTASAVCLGSTVTLTASASGGDGSYTYSWLPTATTGTSVTVTPGVPVTYTVTVNDNCGTPISTAAIPITINPVPTVKIKSDIASGCGTPLCVQFTDSTSATCTGIMWNFGDNDSTATSNPKHCYLNTGSFDVSLKCTDTNGCSATSTITGMINVYTKPVPAFSYTPSAGIIQDSAVSFSNLSTGASTLLWNFGDPISAGNNSSLLNNPTHSYSDTGMYCVKLFAYGNTGCVDSTSQCLKVDEACSIPSTIPNVFSPNGDNMNDIFTIKSSGLSQLICTLYNRWGMLIYEYDAVKTGWDGHTFSDSKAPDGTYYYILKATCAFGGKELKGNGFLQLVR